MKSGYEVVIGLEVHVQLRTRSKMFCACPNLTAEPPNTLTCPVCLGLPGALPVLNREAVRMAILLGLALDAEIRPRSRFYRKQDFYPDLPKGYQITQGPVAIVENGRLEIPADPEVRGGDGPVLVQIERAHLEEDAGKSHHDMGLEATHVDLNRAGVPLLEIVGAPALRSPQEASDYLKLLHRLVMGLGICDGNLEDGSFRCDANISVRRPGDQTLGTRVEVKNLNSFRFVRQALAFETARHVDCLAKGETIVQETRGWDAVSGETRGQRSKETAVDYRTFPEPDLPVLVVDALEVEAARGALPELPHQKVLRWCEELGLGEDEAQALLQSSAFTVYFEALSEACGAPRAAAKWMLGEVSRTLNERGGRIEQFPLSPEALGGLIKLVEDRAISFGAAREQVFPLLMEGHESAESLVARLGLNQVSDRAAIEAHVAAVITAHPGQAEQHRCGSKNLLGFFTGQVLKAGGGKLDPKVVQEVLLQALAKS